MALPHHAQPMPVDSKQRRRVRAVECTFCSEDGSLVYSTALAWKGGGKRAWCLGQSMCCAPCLAGTTTARTLRGSTQTAPVAARSVHCAQHNACSVSLMCGCCYNVGRRNGMIRHRSCRGMCMGISLPLDRDRQSQYQHRATAATPRPGTLPPPCVSMLMRSRSRLFWPE